MADTTNNLPFLSTVLNGQTVLVKHDEVLEIPYDGLQHTVTVNNGYGASSGTLSGTAAVLGDDVYEVYTGWIDNNNDVHNITLRWKITPQKFPKPTVNPENPTLTFVYEGYAGYENNNPVYHRPDIINYNSKVMQTPEGTLSAYKAGDYSIVYKLKDTDSASWEDGSIEDVIINWKINKRAVPIPYFTPVEGNEHPEIFIYDGNYHSPNVTGYNPAFMTRIVHSTSVSSAQPYYITYNLRDTDSAYWDDSEQSTSAKILNWEILKALVRYPKPALDNTNLPFTYNGRQLDPTILNYVEKIKSGSYFTKVMNKTGTLNSVSACKRNENGEYIPWEITIEFYPAQNYVFKWEDDPSEDFVNSTEKVVLPWIIQRAVIKEPYFKDGINEFIYSVTSISPTVEGYDSYTMNSPTGDTNASHCGDYHITYTLKDNDSATWENHPNDNAVTIDWKITKCSVSYPAIGETVLPIKWVSGHYHSQTPVITYAGDTEKYILTTRTAKTEAGEYEFDISLRSPNDSYWEDTNDTAVRTVKWKIIKFDNEYAAKPLFKDNLSTEIEFDYDGTTKTPALYNISQSSQYYLMNGSRLHRYEKLESTDGSVFSEQSAGEYHITYVPFDNPCADVFWEDDYTKEPYTLNWKINKSSFKKPDLKRKIFKFINATIDVLADENEENFNSNVMTRVSGSITKAASANTYKIIYSLKDKTSATWEDGSVDDYEVEWSIVEADPVEIPQIVSPVPPEFTYNGSYHSVTVSEYDTNLVYLKSGSLNAVNANIYELVFALKDPALTMWTDGTNTPKTITWKINKSIEKIPKPYLEDDQKEFNYRVDNITPVISNFVSAKMNKDGNVTEHKADDNYTIVISLKEDANHIYRWEDGTEEGSSEETELSWKIKPITIPVPKLDKSALFYGGMFQDKYFISYSWRQPMVEGLAAIKKYVNCSGVENQKALIRNEYYDGTKFVENGNWYGIHQWALGKYYIEIEPKDNESCFWEDDGTSAKLTFEWSIVREIKLIPKPELLDGNFIFDGMEHSPVLNIASEGVVTSNDTKATSAGNYTICVALRIPQSDTDLIDYRWEDNSTDTISFQWEITKNSSVKIPVFDWYSVPYDGLEHKPAIVGMDEMVVEAKSYSEQTAAGDYDVIFSLKDKISSSWSDGTTDDKVITWHITKSRFKKPTISPEYLTYDGTVHTVEFVEKEDGHSFVISDYDANVMNAEKDMRGTVVKNYETIVKLKDPESASWEDGSIDDISLPWKIIKKVVKLDKPYLEQDTFAYDGNRKTPKVLSPNETYLKTGIKVEGETFGIETGDYIIHISLAEDNNITYSWGAESGVVITDPFDLTWHITPIVVELPSVSPLEFVYNGIVQKPEVVYDRQFVDADGVFQAINSGTYTIKFKLKSTKSTTWSNGTIDDIEKIWKITPITIEKPYLEDTVHSYDGTVKKPTVIGYDDSKRYIINASGIFEATNAGVYKVIFSLTNPESSTWTDGTKDDVEYEWQINKVQLEKPYIKNTTFTYNGGTQTPTLIGYDDVTMRQTGNSSAIDANDYSIVVYLRDVLNYEWADGTTENVVLPWVIKKRSYDKPKLVPEKFVYDGKQHRPNIEGFRSVAMNRGKYDYETAIGEYTVIITLNKNYCWADETDTPLELKWWITKIPIHVPKVENLEYTYDGVVHAPDIEEYDRSIIKQVGTEQATNAGNYNIIFQLADKEYNMWEDTGSSEDYKIPWIIHTIVLPFEVTNTHFVYNGGLQKPTITGFDSHKMHYKEYSVIEAVDANVYKFTVILNDINYRWEDGTTEPKSYTWVIERKIITMPYLVPTEFEYDGQTHTPEIRGFNSDVMYYPADYNSQHRHSAWNVGTYYVLIGLGEYYEQYEGYRNFNFKWTDGSIGLLHLYWKITQKKIKYPALKKDQYEYNGEYQSPEVEGYDPAYMRMIGDYSEQERGSYKIGFEITDTIRYEWEDGTDDNKFYDWEIVKGKLKKSENIPVQNPVLVYNGNEQIPAWDGYDPDKLIFKDTKSAADAGIYTAHFCPTDNFTWEDGTIDDIAVKWVIEKLALEIPAQYEILYYNGKEQEPEWLVTYRSLR